MAYAPRQERRFERREYGTSDGHGGDGAAADDRSIGEVVSDLTAHAQQLVRGELELFKAEMAQKASEAGRYVAMGAAAAVLALVALVLLGHVLAWALALALPLWASYLIVLALYVVAAAALGVKARNGLRDMQPAPEESIDRAKEDISWVKTHT